MMISRAPVDQPDEAIGDTASHIVETLGLLRTTFDTINDQYVIDQKTRQYLANELAAWAERHGKRT